MTPNAEALIDREAQLLDKWADGRKGFVRDGVVDAEKYLASKVKLLYLLKEVNGGSDWDLREFLRCGGRKHTWENIARWTMGINRLPQELPWEQIAEISDEQRKELLQSICAVNVKKTSGTHTADAELVSKAAVQDAEFLKRQIEIYSPSIVVCCGTAWNYWHDIMGIEPRWEMTSRGIWFFRNTLGQIIISFSHPEARIKDSLLYYGLIDAVREIME